MPSFTKWKSKTEICGASWHTLKKFHVLAVSVVVFQLRSNMARPSHFIIFLLFVGVMFMTWQVEASGTPEATNVKKGPESVAGKLLKLALEKAEELEQGKRPTSNDRQESQANIVVQEPGRVRHDRAWALRRTDQSSTRRIRSHKNDAPLAVSITII
jgi:hypothetical protein